MNLQLVAVILAAAPAATGTAELTSNTNRIVQEHRADLQFSCSTFWPSWEPRKAFDGNPLKSWFTQRGDAAALGREPWIAIAFPRAMTIRRVTVLANREHPWQIGFRVLVVRMELLDRAGEILYSVEQEASADDYDMEIRAPDPVSGVWKVRIVSVKDEGDQNTFQDVGIGEVLIE